MTAVHTLATPDEDAEADAGPGVPIELTVVFTDLEDFTTYTEAAGDEAASRLLMGHQRESAAIVAGRGGRVLKRLGDGLMLTFPRPEAAVLACLEVAESAPLPLRAGVHCGMVLVTADDITGHVVNLAARVTGSAAPGELVVTDHVRAAVGDLRCVTFDGPFKRTFKGIEDRIAVYVASRHVCRFAGPRTDPVSRRTLDGGHT